MVDKTEYPLMLTSNELHELIAYLDPFPRYYILANIARKMQALKMKIAEGSDGSS